MLTIALALALAQDAPEDLVRKLGVDDYAEREKATEALRKLGKEMIQGAFGEVNLGSENSAGYKMTYAAPDVTFVNVNSGSLTAFVPFSGTADGLGTGNGLFRQSLGTTFLENGGNNARGGDDEPESTDLHIGKLPVVSARARARAAEGWSAAAGGRCGR